MISLIQPKNINLVRLCIGILTIGVILTIPFIGSAYAEDIEKKCEFKADSLLFTSRLLRVNGKLSGYEVTVKNTGAKDFTVFNHPELPEEATHMNVYEFSMDRKKIKKVSVRVKAYMVDSDEKQKWFYGGLKAGEKKVFTVNIVDKLMPGYELLNDRLYDLDFGTAFSFQPPDQAPNLSYAETVRRSAEIRAQIGSGTCLTYSNVKAVEP